MKNVTKLVDKQGLAILDYLGANLLRGITPEVAFADGSEPLFKNWDAKYDPTAYRLLTEPYLADNFQHIDIFSGDFTMTYDLGASYDINGIFTSGYWHCNSGVYMLGIYECYVSDSKQDLYSPENLILRCDNEELCAKRSTEPYTDTYFDCIGHKGRYFGFKLLKANSIDDITRMARLGVYSTAENGKRLFLESLVENNLLSADCITLPTDSKGDISSLLNGSVFERADSVSISGDIIIENKGNCEKLLIMGIFEGAEFFAADERDALFSSPAAGDLQFCDTADHEELCILLTLPSPSKFLGIRLGEGALIEQLGTYTYKRKARAQLDNIRTEDFIGVGANDIPMTWMPESRRDGFRNAYWPVYIERMKKANPSVLRVWFQVDWCVTEEEDYNQGICNFKSDKMRAFLKFMDMYEEAGIEIEFNFGWKASTEIQEWFSLPHVGPSRVAGSGKAASAPKNIEGFAKCCATTVKFLCEERGYTCIKHLTFYNEAAHAEVHKVGSDFGGYYERTKQVWEQILRLVDKELKANGADKYVDYWVAEIAGPNETIYNWIDYMEENCSDMIAAHSIHRYDLRYTQRMDFFKEARRRAGDRGIIATEFAVYSNPAWNLNNMDCVMSMLKTGFRGGLYWTFQGTVFTDPTWIGAGDSIPTCHSGFWGKAYTKNSWHEFYPFYEFSLFTRYLPRHSKVIESTNSHDDCRIEIIETPDGEYSVFIESKASSQPKTIEVEFSKPIGKKFQKHVYKEKNVSLDGNLIVPPVLKELEVDTLLTDTIDTDYQLVCYTTIPALKQIKLNKRKLWLPKGEEFTFEAETIDCEGEFAWELVSSDGVPCSIDQNGHFTQADLTLVGDIQCIKAYLKNDPEVYAIAMIEIVE